MQKPITAAERQRVPVKFVIVTLDSHLAGAVERALPQLQRAFRACISGCTPPRSGGDNPDALARCRADIETADIVVVHHAVHGGSYPGCAALARGTPR